MTAQEEWISYSGESIFLGKNVTSSYLYEFRLAKAEIFNTLEPSSINLSHVYFFDEKGKLLYLGNFDKGSLSFIKKNIYEKENLKYSIKTSQIEPGRFEFDNHLSLRNYIDTIFDNLNCYSSISKIKAKGFLPSDCNIISYHYDHQNRVVYKSSNNYVPPWILTFDIENNIEEIKMYFIDPPNAENGIVPITIKKEYYESGLIKTEETIHQNFSTLKKYHYNESDEISTKESFANYIDKENKYSQSKFTYLDESTVYQDLFDHNGTMLSRLVKIGLKKGRKIPNDIYIPTQQKVPENKEIIILDSNDSIITRYFVNLDGDQIKVEYYKHVYWDQNKD